jgi:hypothetical protein
MQPGLQFTLRAAGFEAEDRGRWIILRQRWLAAQKQCQERHSGNSSMCAHEQKTTSLYSLLAVSLHHSTLG